MTDDRCEFCDAPLVAWRDRGNDRKYACGTRRRHIRGSRPMFEGYHKVTRTRRCRRAEIERLAKRVAALEAKPKQKPKAKRDSK